MLRRLVLLIVIAGLACTGCAQVQQIGKNQERIEEIDSRIDKIEVISADLDAIKAYFKDVSTRTREMRDDMVGILDEQNVRVDEGRASYIKILQRQKEMLAGMQAEVDKAIQALNKELPVPAKAVSETPVAPALKDAPGDTPTPAKQ